MITAIKTLEHYLNDISKLNGVVESLTNEVSYLKEQLEWFKRQIFGQKADKFVDLSKEQQLCFEGFDKLVAAPLEDKKIIPAHERSKSKRNGQDTITLPANLPIERHVLDIPEEAKICPETGKSLVKIGEEVTSKIAQKPGCYFIIQIIRPKYALPQDSEGGILTAALPDSLLNRCQADESFLADILVKKFADHLPLYRISEILRRENILISRQILSQWVLRCGEALEPLYNEMLKKILESGNIFIDESPIDMLKPGNGKVHQGYMWVVVGGKDSSDPPYRIYNFCESRAHKHAVDLIGDYHGALHSDKYGAYENLASRKQIIWCPCWTHVRRKFVEAEGGDPPFRQWVLRQIKYLYMFERIAWTRSAEERLKIRQEKEAPIIDKLIEAIKEKLIDGKILPKSKFRTALGYFLGLVPYLKNYTKYAWTHIDNNVAERAVRPLAIGRKNWLFVGSKIGGKAAAIILSLVQSCRAIGVNPRDYLEDVMRRLMSHSASKLSELLPDQWAKARQQTTLPHTTQGLSAPR